MIKISLALQRTLIFLGIFFFIVSCTKDSAGGSEIPEENPADLSAKQIAKKLYADYYVPSISTGEDIAWTGSVQSCNPGTIPQSTKEKIFNRLTYFRKAVGLHNEIIENSTKSEKAQWAALMMSSNNQLDHFPPESWKCYSTEGKDGAGNSLLASTKNAEAIDLYLRDAGSDNGAVGHRRWLLWPRLHEVGVGNTNGTNALWVLGMAGTPPADAPEYISWPPKGYVPGNLAYPRWSFSIENADFSSTQVSMYDDSGAKIAVETEELVGIYGDNTIVWVPLINWMPALTPDTLEKEYTYTVKLSNVGINGELKNFEYFVTLFDPNS
ncbi:MAG: CAP domain-containing protein [Flavobacteriaceae bacterium]